MRTYISLIKLFPKYNSRWLFLFLVVWTIILWVTRVYEPIFVKRVLDVMLQRWSDGWDLNTLKMVVIQRWGFILFLILWKWRINNIYRKKLLNAYNGFFVDAVKKIHRMSYGDYLSTSKSKISQSIYKWVEPVWDMTSSFFKDHLIQSAWLVTVTIVLFVMNWRMALLTLSMLPFLIFITLYFDRKTFVLQKDLDAIWDEWYHLLGDSMTNMWVVKTFTLENKRDTEIKELRSTALQKQRPIQRRRMIHDSYMQITTMTARLIVVWWWMRLFSLWYTTVSEVVTFFIYVNFVYYPLMTILSWMDRVVKQLVWFEKLCTFLDDLTKRGESLENWWEITWWDIVFDGVWFWYSSKKMVLQDISFTLGRWKTIALVWVTWAWKSTLAHLLLRFREPTQGTIRRWDVGLWSYSLRSLRDHIWTIQQDTTLFNTTIRNNLERCLPETVDDMDETKKQQNIEEALRLAQADFVFSLPDWIETRIGERWLKLSWGEKQRIALARLLLKNPEVIIMDEATSALDITTEHLIKQVIDTHLSWRTKLIIAHRLSTIKEADEILVIGSPENTWGTGEKTKENNLQPSVLVSEFNTIHQGSTILERGTYDELMKERGVLWKMAHPEQIDIRV